MYFIINTLFFTGLFCTLDRILEFLRLEGRYYLIHSFHNAMIVGSTASDVFNTITDFNNLTSYEVNTFAAQICFALHFYHIVWYHNKFRIDDWLHHILMVGLALPIGCLLDSHTLLGFSLFFTTGLPGAIDYLLLFLTRNFWIDRLIEKKINRELNVWIRSPGCIAHAVATLTWTLTNHTPIQSKWHGIAVALSCLAAMLNYWNGQYFMAQVVEDYARRTIQEIDNQV